MSHSGVVGGSAAGRIIACPPSRLGAEKIPRIETEYAKRGTALHQVMEQLFAGRRPMDIVDTEVNDVFISRELFDSKVLPAMEAFTRYAEEHPILTRRIEQHVEIPPIPGAFGTADVVLYHKDAISVIDWKFGDGVQVDIEDNAQLLFYAAGVMLGGGESETYHLVVIQPNDRGLPVTRSVTVNRWMLYEFISTLRWAVNNGHRDELLSSGPHCRWCPVKPVCPKLRADVTALSKWTNPHPELTSLQVGEYVALAEQAEEWAAAVKQYAHERLENGETVDGYKLVPKRAIRQWERGVDVVSALDDRYNAARGGHFDDAQLFKKELKSPAQIEKEFKISTDGLTEARSSGTTLARDDDTREAVVPSNPLRRLAKLIGEMK